LEDILPFAHTESFETAYNFIFTKLKEKNPRQGGASLEKVYEEIEKPIIPVVKEMENHGILIDKKYFEKLSEEYHKELDILTKKIYSQAGTEFNINSPKQLGEILFGKLGMKSPGKNKAKKNASGAFSTKISVLEELEGENEIIKEIMAYRELQKLLSTYIDVIPKMAGEDGRLGHRHTSDGTAARGRLPSHPHALE